MSSYYGQTPSHPPLFQLPCRRRVEFLAVFAPNTLRVRGHGTTLTCLTSGRVALIVMDSGASLSWRGRRAQERVLLLVLVLGLVPGAGRSLAGFGPFGILVRLLFALFLGRCVLLRRHDCCVLGGC